MTPCTRAALVALLVCPAATAAQHAGGGGGAQPRAFTAPAEATQWDFLVGQWELTVKPKVSGLAARIHGAPRLVGTWKAWRAFDGFGIEDDLRIVDGSGNPRSLSHAIRVYSAAGRRWIITGLDVYRAQFSTSTAEWKNGEMLVTGRGTDAEGKPVVTRTRYFGITANGFRYRQDRSTDDGRTWEEGVLAIEAKRVAAVAPR